MANRVAQIWQSEIHSLNHMGVYECSHDLASNLSWRISHANQKFSLCPSLPEYIGVPKLLTDRVCTTTITTTTI